jgi:hypothetical protein
MIVDVRAGDKEKSDGRADRPHDKEPRHSGASSTTISAGSIATERTIVSRLLPIA